MRGLLTDSAGNNAQSLKRIELNNTPFTENWLQEQLHNTPSLIPLNDIAPGAGAYVPICRELAIPKPGRPVFLDLFGVTPNGRLVLIECKLWRNPQARREVVAQALEYASLIRAWSYADLTTRLKSKLDSPSPNPLYDLVKGHEGALGEAAFVDQVTRSLKLGDFIVLIAGDGIRSDVQAMAEHLNASASAAIFSLLEIQLWQGNDDQLIILPALPLTTQVIKQRVLVSANGTPLEIEAQTQQDRWQQEEEARIDPEFHKYRKTIRQFWQTFIDTATFDHAQQPAPRHGSHGYVRLAMPDPIPSIVAYRNKLGEAGLFFNLHDDEGKGLFHDLKASAEQLTAEIGIAPEFQIDGDDPFKGVISFTYPYSITSDEALLNWLSDAANKITASLRAFLSQY